MMKDERTEAEKHAHTLRYLVNEGFVPGLLPRDVLAAADLLVEQEKELALARQALAAKEHVVNVEISEPVPYRKAFGASFIITDPRVYHGEIDVDDYVLREADTDYLLILARRLTRAATDVWLRELTEKTAISFHQALKRDQAKAA
jgi:hypothetical protein